MKPLVANRTSRMLGMSRRAETKASSVPMGRLATSPPDTTTSRTPGVRRKYSRICSYRVCCGTTKRFLSTWGTSLPTRSMRVQWPQYCGQVDSTSASTLVG